MSRRAKKRGAAFFCMPEEGHYRLLRPLIAGLAGRRFRVAVFTHQRFGSDVRRLGGVFVDLFGKYPIERADAASLPVPCRYVTFAARYADDISQDLKKFGPSVVVYETFSVAGRVSAASLGVPFINVSSGHNMSPGRVLPLLRADPRVRLSGACLRAVRILRERHGLRDASPFSYATALSPFLNIYCEPAAYLDREDRPAFEPAAFYGCLPPPEDLKAGEPKKRDSFFPGDGSRLKLYACFGTVIWRYYAKEALAALKAVCACAASLRNACALISLGGAKIGITARRALTRPNVRLVDTADQWGALGEADAFVTHHGLCSTHEAIYRRTPMISYPFFGDQPALAKKCQKLGLAVPLVKSPLDPVGVEDVRAALTELSRKKEALNAAMKRAWGWERDTWTARDSVLDRIAGFAG